MYHIFKEVVQFYILTSNIEFQFLHHQQLVLSVKDMWPYVSRALKQQLYNLI